MGRHAFAAKTPHEEVTSLLAQMKDAAKDPAQFEQLSDQLSVLTAAYMVPTAGYTYSREYGFTKAMSRIFDALKQNINKPMTKSALLNALAFDSPDEPHIKIIDVFICKIRRALKDINAPYHIETIWGVGYKLANHEADH